MKKGVVLVVVIGVMLVIFTLAVAALFLMTQESRIAEHKIKRTKAFFAAQGGMVLAMERLRLGTWAPNAKYCLSNGVAPGLGGCADTVTDNQIPYDVEINVSAVSGGSNPIAGVSQVNIKVVY